MVCWCCKAWCSVVGIEPEFTRLGAAIPFGGVCAAAGDLVRVILGAATTFAEVDSSLSGCSDLTF